MTISTDKEQTLLSSEDSSFDDIRPCQDHEVQQELQRTVADKMVIDSILKFRYPILSKHISFLLRPIVRKFLSKKICKLTTVADFQKKVAQLVDHVVATTTDGVEYVGFDKLDKSKGHLFITNHRDISLDPAFVDMAMTSNGMQTVRIAIGDNLLKIPAATSLMRLNKSFIVKRSAMSPREKLKALSHLSAYIGCSLNEGHSIWIAQREGRAKDGDDRTEEAVLKMIALYGRSLKKTFAEYMSTLNIVPVSITYEFDPNDQAKANELNTRAANNGEYKKSQFEDIDTITRGIRGYKGRIKLVAGDPITEGFDSAEDLAKIIDNFIWKNYELFPISKIAAGHSEEVTPTDLKKFDDYMSNCPDELRKTVLAMYAKPYENAKNIVE